MDLAPRLGLRSALDALCVELPHHLRVDLIEAKTSDPRHEEAVEQLPVAVDRGGLEPGRCERSQVLGRDLLEGEAASSPPADVLPSRVRRLPWASRWRREGRAAAAPPPAPPRAIEPPRRDGTAPAIRLVLGTRCQGPAAACRGASRCALSWPNCLSTTRASAVLGVPRRGPTATHAQHHAAGPVHEGWSHTRQWRPSFRARMPSMHASTEPSGARLALRPMRRRSVIVGTPRIPRRRFNAPP